MPDLIAQGPERKHRWRRPLPNDVSPRWLGRADSYWSIPWDACVSRRHAELVWRPPYLEVRRDPSATNPIFLEGVAQEAFRIRGGQHFVIGDTTFSLVDPAARISLDLPAPIDRQQFSADVLRRVNFRHAQQQVQSLLRLPEILSSGVNEQDLWVRLVNLLLTSIPHVQMVGVISEENSPSKPAAVPEAVSSIEARRILHWDRIDSDLREFYPSGKLITESLRTGQSVVHRWLPSSPTAIGTGTQKDSPSSRHQDASFRLVDWAFCTPIPGSACRGTVLYVGGTSSSSPETDEDDLMDSLKFTEFVATTVGNVSDVRNLQRRASALAPFFSPLVREALVELDPETVLAPRETEACVLFCDLHGFSRRSEQSANDLMGLLERVSQSLGIVTHQILESGGVIGDFHGDAAMGFWGWPLPQHDLVLRACRAALAIEKSFADLACASDHPLHDFRVGLGLATGSAVAGKIGTTDQVKVTVFGPVVNVASRLEGLTRLLGVSILLDETTAQRVQRQLPPDQGRLRLLATVRPYGMQTAQNVYELRPYRGDIEASAAMQSEIFQQAREQFVLGNWTLARSLFEQLSADNALRQFYLDAMRRSSFQPPEDWAGVLNLTSK